MGFELESGTATEEQQGTTQTQPEGNGERSEKTFTQDEVNKIVSERLARDKGKNSAELEKREHELEQRELAMTAREKLAERGLPKELAEVLRFSDDESMNKSIDAIEKIINENKTQGVTFRGFQPGQSLDFKNADSQLNSEMRKAMGLR